MKSISIKLPERVFEELQRLAKTAEVSVDDLTTDIVVDAVYAGRSSGKVAVSEYAQKRHQSETSTALRAKSVTGAESDDTWGRTQPHQPPKDHAFLVAKEFSGRDRTTVDQAQKFVNAALDYEDVRAFRNDEGIGFDPNFVFIERVYSKEIGFAASFYGSPEKFSDYGITMESGRGGSYSRYKVKSPQDLDVALKALHISAHFKELERKGG